MPELINSEDISIFDENNVPISICAKSTFILTTNIFKPPFILVDNFEKKKYQQIEIKRIDLDHLERIGYRLVSLKTTKKTKNHPRQLKSYLLESISSPIPNSEVMGKIPKEHYIEIDVIGNRIRIKGKNGYPYLRAQNATPWIFVGGSQ